MRLVSASVTSLNTPLLAKQRFAAGGAEFTAAIGADRSAYQPTDGGAYQRDDGFNGRAGSRAGEGTGQGAGGAAVSFGLLVLGIGVGIGVQGNQASANHSHGRAGLEPCDSTPPHAPKASGSTGPAAAQRIAQASYPAWPVGDEYRLRTAGAAEKVAQPSTHPAATCTRTTATEPAHQQATAGDVDRSTQDLERTEGGDDGGYAAGHQRPAQGDVGRLVCDAGKAVEQVGQAVGDGVGQRADGGTNLLHGAFHAGPD